MGGARGWDGREGCSCVVGRVVKLSCLYLGSTLCAQDAVLSTCGAETCDAEAGAPTSSLSFIGRWVLTSAASD